MVVVIVIYIAHFLLAYLVNALYKQVSCMSEIGHQHTQGYGFFYRVIQVMFFFVFWSKFCIENPSSLLLNRFLFHHKWF